MMNELVPEAFQGVLGATVLVGALAVILVLMVAARRCRARWTDHPATAASESRLQLLDEPQSGGPRERPQALLPQARGKTVVLADDDAAWGKSYAIRLESLGLAVIRSSNATDALLDAHRTAPNLVILDVTMPSGNGLAVCEMIAADPQCSHIPVIIFTGDADSRTIERCNRLGAHYLHKSADAWDQLRALVIELLNLDSEEAAEGEKAIPQTPLQPTPPTLASVPGRPLPSAVADQPPPAEQPSQADSGEERDPLLAMLASGPLPEKTEPALASLLCIDENASTSERIARQLQPYGIRVMAAGDVESGYLMCYSVKPSAILLDSAARGGKYQEALTHLRAHPFVAGAPIIVMGPAREAAAAREMGALKGIRFLTKPLDTVELVQELRSHASFAGIEPPRAPKRESLASHEGPAAREPAARKPEPAAAGPKPDGVRPKPDGRAEDREDDAPSAEVRPRPRVLVIDDDPAVSRAMAIRLRPLGVDVFHAFNGMQGYWTGLDINPDVIITDLKMPEGEGNYIFSRFQSHPLTKDVPVIVLTGETNPAVKRTMLSLGVSAYFTKPWNFDELLRELGSHIDLRPADTDRTRAPAPA